MNFYAIVIALAFYAVGPARAQETTGPATREYRVSALIQGAQGYLVGFVDAASGQSFYIPENGSARGITVVKVDYKAERIELNIGSELRELYLTDAPDSRTVKTSAVYTDEPYLDDMEPYPENETNPVPATAQGPSEELKAMMAQFPDAVPTNFMNQPNTIQQIMEQHPELADKMNQPAGRYGAGIEAMLKLYPALSNRMQQADTTLFPYTSLFRSRKSVV